MGRRGPSVRSKKAENPSLEPGLGLEWEAVVESLLPAVPPMTRLFLDSADPAHWQSRAGSPPLNGITTNPSLIRQSGQSVSLDTYLKLVEAAASAPVDELMLQVPWPDPEAFDPWLKQLRSKAEDSGIRLTLKVPCHSAWLPVIRRLKDEGVAVLLTGLSNPVQLLWAEALRVDAVAPYVGRIAETGRNPWPLLRACATLQQRGLKLLAASIRDLDTLARLIALGCDAVTLRPEFLDLHVEDDLTRSALAQFDRDVIESLRAPPSQPR